MSLIKNILKKYKFEEISLAELNQYQKEFDNNTIFITAYDIRDSLINIKTLDRFNGLQYGFNFKFFNRNLKAEFKKMAQQLSPLKTLDTIKFNNQLLDSGIIIISTNNLSEEEKSSLKTHLIDFIISSNQKNELVTVQSAHVRDLFLTSYQEIKNIDKNAQRLKNKYNYI